MHSHEAPRNGPRSTYGVLILVCVLVFILIGCPTSPTAQIDTPAGQNDTDLILTISYDSERGNVNRTPEKDTYQDNESITITATPKDTYLFSTLLVDGVRSTDNPYTFTITGDTTAQALFTPSTPSVTEIEATVINRTNREVEVSWKSSDSRFYLIASTEEHISREEIPILNGMFCDSHTKRISLDDYGEYYFHVIPTQEQFDAANITWQEFIDSSTSSVFLLSPYASLAKPTISLYYGDANTSILLNGESVSSSVSIRRESDPDPDNLGVYYTYRVKKETDEWTEERILYDSGGFVSISLPIDAGEESYTVEAYYTYSGIRLTEKTTMSFTVVASDSPRVVSLQDTAGVDIADYDRTKNTVLLTVQKPDNFESGGSFHYSADDGITWVAFSTSTTNLFSVNPGEEKEYSSYTIKYTKGSLESNSVKINSFTIDAKAPTLPEPTVTAGNLEISVGWTLPPDDDFTSLIIESRPSAGAYSTYAAITPGSGTISPTIIPSEATLDIRVSAYDDVLNETQYEFLNQTPTTNLDVLYVSQEGSGLGGSWQSSSELQEAIERAHTMNIPEVWVMEGTYKPKSHPNYTTAPSGPDWQNHYHFSLRNGVTVIGGFKGDETEKPATRDSSKTILTGTDVGYLGGDAYHVLYHPTGTGLDHTARLEDVTITGGRATKPYNNIFNKGIVGGGILNEYSSPVFVNCTIRDNEANVAGGGVYNSNSQATFINCSIQDNRIHDSMTGEFWYGGGGVYNFASQITYINTIISGNTATSGKGGGIYSHNSNTSNASGVYVSPGIVFHNCEISDNDAAYANGKSVYQVSSSLALNNSIVSQPNTANDAIYNDSSISENHSSLIQPSSAVVINKGDKALLPPDTFDLDRDGDTDEDLPLDLNFHTRVLGGALDIGPIEYQ